MCLSFITCKKAYFEFEWHEHAACWEGAIQLSISSLLAVGEADIFGVSARNEVPFATAALPTITLFKGTEKGRKRFLLSTQRIVVGQTTTEARARERKRKSWQTRAGERVDFWHTGGLLPAKFPRHCARESICQRYICAISLTVSRSTSSPAFSFVSPALWP